MLTLLKKDMARMMVRIQRRVLAAPHTIEVSGMYLLGEKSSNIDWVVAQDTYYSLMDELFARLLPDATVLSQRRHRLALLLDADVPTDFATVVNEALAPYLTEGYHAAMYVGGMVFHDLLAEDLSYDALRGRAEDNWVDVLFYNAAPFTLLVNKDVPPKSESQKGWYEGSLSYDLRLHPGAYRLFRITGIKNLSETDENR